MIPDKVDYLRYAWHLINGFRVQVEQKSHQIRRQDISPYLDLDQPLKVLDLANGRLRPQSLLLAQEGHRVYGIDLVNRPTRSLTDQAYSVARWLYRQRLGPWPLNNQSPALLYGNVNHLPFGTHTFDLITSIAAFEHFLDVPMCVAELARVLRPGGVVWVGIHLFTALSGGHNTRLIEFPLRHLPTGAEPWDHLRQRKLPFHVPLNEWRIDQYLETFDRHFNIIKHYCRAREGLEFLTPDIQSELADYHPDELTCRSYVIVARSLKH